MKRVIAEAYREDPPTEGEFGRLVRAWLEGRSFAEIAHEVSLPVDDLLAVHTRVVAYELQTAVEQGIAVLPTAV